MRRRWWSNLNSMFRRTKCPPAAYVSPYDKPNLYANQLGAYADNYLANQARDRQWGES